MRWYAPVCLSILLLLSSCRPEKEPVSLEVPPTPVLTSKAVWGLVNLPYLKILAEADPVAEVTGLLREDDLVEILSKKGLEDGTVYWLEVQSEKETGWVPESALDVYDSRAQALTASHKD